MNTTSRTYIGKEERNVGIDVGKNQLDICIYEKNEYWQTGNNAKDLKALTIKLKRYKLTRILVEATGGYERKVVEACA